jgi:hypothetical protein
VEQFEDAASLAPVPVFVDDTGRRRRLTRRIGRVLLVGFCAYIGLVMMGFARDPRLGALHLPTIGLPDLGLMIPPTPLVLGEQTTRAAADNEIEVSTAGASDGDLAAPASGGPSVPSSGGAPGPSTKPGGVAPVPGPTPGRPPGPGSSTTSTSTTTTTTARTDSPTTSATTAPSTPASTIPTPPGQGSVTAKGPDGSGPPGRAADPPGQQRKTTTTTAG